MTKSPIDTGMRGVHPSLYDALEKCAGLNPRSYLEIGVREGDSLMTLLSSCQSVERIVLSDVWGFDFGGSGRGNHDHIQKALDEFGYKGSVSFLDGFSQETIPSLTESFDLALIDGDHSLEGAMADLRNVWPMVKQGGVILFDDTTHPAHSYLEQAFKDFIKEKECEHFLSIRDESSGVDGLLKT